jgi:hypothetical protein
VDKRAVLATALTAGLLGWAPTAAAQDLPECAPDKAFNVTLETQEKGQDAPLIATHEVLVTAQISGDAARASLAFPAGVRVLGVGSDGTNVNLILPNTTSLDVAVSWRQSADPSDPESTERCAATRLVTLPVLSARPSRSVRQGPRQPIVSDFAVVPALTRPNLEPLDITIRTTSRVRFPSRSARPRRWSVPMRNGEQLTYDFRLPGLAGISTAKLCRFWWLICGPVNGSVAALNLDDKALRRGIERPDLDGNNAIQRLLARSQPARWAARWGVLISVFPGAGKVQPFGFDVQVRQSGRLLARIRKAGRCRDIRDSRGIFHHCTVARSRTMLR